MKIQIDTTQEQLIALSNAAIKQHQRKSLPINRSGLAMLMLFIFFPGMILGFKRGLFFTLLVTLCMTGIMIFGSEEWTFLIAKYYLMLGACAAAVAFYLRLKSWKHQGIELHNYLEANSSAPGCHGREFPQKASFKMQKATSELQEDTIWKAYIDIHINKQGVYAFLIELENYGQAHRLETASGQESCYFEWGPGKSPDYGIMLYRFAAGTHRLQMLITPHPIILECPKLKLTQINQFKHETPSSEQ